MRYEIITGEEQSVIKSHRYWPFENTTMKFDDAMLKVSNISEKSHEKMEELTVRKLRIIDVSWYITTKLNRYHYC